MYPCSLQRNWRYGFSLAILVSLVLIFYSVSPERRYPRYSMGRNPLSVTSTQHHVALAALEDTGPHRDFPVAALNRELDYNINGNDVIVFLHVQKTGGTTFGKHLTRNLQIPGTSLEGGKSSPPCECIKRHKRCMCYRPSSKHQIWLFSRLSTGWMCGLHADMTELKACVPDAMDRREKIQVRRRYFYITMVRNPISRYISEWKHTQRGATWKFSQHMCNGRPATSVEVPVCFSGSTWMGVSLKEFVGCPSNLAHNRQTRMIADLTVVNCYNRTGMTQREADRKILASAKANLESIAFFGLTEYQRESQYLFERTFRMRFREPLEQSNVTIANASPVSPDQLELVHSRNLLDIELYMFAKDLFFQRYNYMRQLDQQRGIQEEMLAIS